MDIQTLTSYLKLLACDGLGVLKARQLLELTKNVNLVFDVEFLKSSSDDVAGSIKNALLNFKHDDLVQQELIFIDENNIQCVGILDDDYPKLLKQCIDAPIILFYKGNLDLAENDCLAVVGSRKMTSYGKEMIQYLIENVKRYNISIVSGMAYGVDINAYYEAVKGKMSFIAVMGTSFKTYYPSAHKKEYDYLFEKGLVITEYAGFNTLVPELFTRRNRIIAGLCNATVVVESALKGGSLSTAYFANDYNRDVYAFPGRVKDFFSEGCLKLIRENRAQILYDVNFLVEDLKWNNAINIPILPEKAEMNLILFTPNQRLILIELFEQSLHIDDLALKTKLEMALLNAELMMLELDNVVVGLPGKIFKLKQKSHSIE